MYDILRKISIFLSILPLGVVIALTMVGIVVGFVIAYFIARRSRKTLGRSGFLLGTAMVALVLSSTGYVWSLYPQALDAQLDWIPLLLVVLAVVVCGYVYGRLAVARSFDAFGRPSPACLALVPVANLRLLLKRSIRSADSGRQAAGRHSSMTALALALLALVPFAMRDSVRALRAVYVAELEQEAALKLEESIRQNGLEKALASLAKKVPTGRINGSTTLVRAEAEGRKLRYIYRVDAGLTDVPVGWESAATKSNCFGSDGAPAILEAGGTITHVFLSSDDAPLLELAIDLATCRAAAP